MKKNTAGFSFIELMLYVALLTTMLVTLIPFAWSIVEGGVKNSTQQETFSQARYITERLKYEIRNATGITSVSATQITLTTSTPATNPTVIDVLSGNMRIKQGAASAVNLNSNNSTVSAVTFTNLSSSDNRSKHIAFHFTVTANFAAVGQAYQESTVEEGSAEVRNN